MQTFFIYLFFPVSISYFSRLLEEFQIVNKKLCSKFDLFAIVCFYCFFF